MIIFSDKLSLLTVPLWVNELNSLNSEKPMSVRVDEVLKNVLLVLALLILKFISWPRLRKCRRSTISEGESMNRPRKNCFSIKNHLLKEFKWRQYLKQVQFQFKTFHFLPTSNWLQQREPKSRVHWQHVSFWHLLLELFRHFYQRFPWFLVM